MNTTAHEMDRDGRVVRVFHRTPTAAWTHPPGEKYRYWNPRSDGWIVMNCRCNTAPVSQGTPNAARTPGPSPAPRTGPQ